MQRILNHVKENVHVSSLRVSTGNGSFIFCYRRLEMLALGPRLHELEKITSISGIPYKAEVRLSRSHGASNKSLTRIVYARSGRTFHLSRS